MWWFCVCIQSNIYLYLQSTYRLKLFVKLLLWIFQDDYYRSVIFLPFAQVCLCTEINWNLPCLASSAVSPPVLSVPPGSQIVNVREGGNADLICQVVDGKPRPPILWSRTEKDLLMPGGVTTVETPDGRLRLRNVSRDMMGLYRCQTAPYNGLNIKRREAQVQLNIQCKCKSEHCILPLP